MNLEEAFLDDIHRHPEEDGRRLIYADWLEEQGDPVSLARAAFVRLEVDLARTAEEEERHERILERLLALRPQVDTSWLAALARVQIEHCETLRFKFRCPKKWDHLRQTEDATVRFCDSCRKTVHYCDSIGEAKAQALLGRCVAVDCSVQRSPGDLDVPSEVDVVGELTLGYSYDPEPDREEKPFWRRWLGW
jgi:uncharacterized protein (TIGR02996 family)